MDSAGPQLCPGMQPLRFTKLCPGVHEPLLSPGLITARLTSTCIRASMICSVFPSDEVVKIEGWSGMSILDDMLSSWLWRVAMNDRKSSIRPQRARSARETWRLYLSKMLQGVAILRVKSIPTFTAIHGRRGSLLSKPSSATEAQVRKRLCGEGAAILPPHN